MPGLPVTRLEKGFALDKLQTRNVLAIKVQEIEGVIDKPHVALAVGRRLGVSEARRSGVVDAAEFAVEIGGLQVQVRERPMILGYLPVQSSPVRVNSCARPSSIRAPIR